MFKKLITSAMFLTGLAFLIAALPAQANFQNPFFHQIPQQTNSLAAFEAQLSGAEEVPAVPTLGSGRAVMVLDEETNQLYYRVTVSDITDITMAHIHIGAIGVNGPIVFPLFPNGGTSFDPDNPISGVLDLDEAEVSELRAGNYYVNVHTTSYPAGEIRGQLEQFVPSAHFYANLSGDEEVPPVPSGASGEALFILDNQAGLNSLQYSLEVSGSISQILAAHFHTGWPGENGPVVITLFDISDGRDFDPDNPISGEVDITAENLRDLLTGYYYVNVHSQIYPAGELRGQVNSHWRIFMPLIEK